MLAEAVSRRALNGARTAVRPTTEAFQALSVSLLYSSRAAGFSRRALHQHQHRRQAELSSSLRQRHSDALSNVAAAQIGKQSALSAFAPQARKLHASAGTSHLFLLGRVLPHHNSLPLLRESLRADKCLSGASQSCDMAARVVRQQGKGEHTVLNRHSYVELKLNDLLTGSSSSSRRATEHS